MVEIVAYREEWPEEFRVIGMGLRQALGGLALRIDHIGSTAVPGLPAKDVIDIQISVAALDAALIAAMTAAGYRQSLRNLGDHQPPHFVGPPEDWKKLFFNPPAGQRRTNTHVRVLGRANQRYPLLFRDYLRAHPRDCRGLCRVEKTPGGAPGQPGDVPGGQRPGGGSDLLRRGGLGRGGRLGDQGHLISKFSGYVLWIAALLQSIKHTHVSYRREVYA